ncbi:ribonuclease P protein subunit p30-like [Physella acuta]|uniref:ribonuclease P protein subunit p30-like n=1 Tax=Physella acuta TaxID=109671 RepID=UPI0027DBF31D|nr:ribonuclease P protein subunit p30-like [Physella acuta]
MAPPVFSDMNLVWSSSTTLLDMIEIAIELGFERIAVNKFISSLEGGKGKKHNEKFAVSQPSDILLNEESLKSLTLKGKKFEQLSRITAVIKDASNTHRLGSPDIQSYDIIAVQPTNEKTFQLACSTLDIDLISLNFTESLGFSLRRQLINLAASRGIFFEIVYSPALINNQAKRYIIANAMSLINAAGGKNIIISSSAEKPIDLRSPMDVMNLARLFGLNHFQAKSAISINCRAVLKHAETRKTCKSVVSVKTITPKEAWILKLQSKEQQQVGSSSSQDEDSEDDDDDDDDSSAQDEPKLKKKKLV